MDKAIKEIIILLKQNGIKLIYGSDFSKPIALCSTNDSNSHLLKHDFSKITKKDFESV